MTYDLVKFLRARLDEDEELRRGARTWTDRDWQVITSPRDDRVTVMDEANVIAWTELDGEPGQRIAAHIVRYDPARTRIDIEAKRLIIAAHHRSGATCPRCSLGTEDGQVVFELDPCDTLRLLALPYRDHPDYQPAWVPSTPATPPA